MHTVTNLWNAFYAAGMRPIVLISHLTFVVSITVVFASAAIAWTVALWRRMPATTAPANLPPLHVHLWHKLYDPCARIARVSLVHLRER